MIETCTMACKKAKHNAPSQIMPVMRKEHSKLCAGSGFHPLLSSHLGATLALNYTAATANDSAKLHCISHREHCAVLCWFLFPLPRRNIRDILVRQDLTQVNAKAPHQEYGARKKRYPAGTAKQFPQRNYDSQIRRGNGNSDQSDNPHRQLKTESIFVFVVEPSDE